MGDAGDELTFHLIFLALGFQFLVADDQRAGQVGLGGIIEGGEHLHDHAFLHGEADRAGLQHLGPHRRQLQHLLIGDEVELARPRHDARVGGVDAIHVGIDVAAIGLDRGGHRHRRRVRPAPAQRRDAPVRHHPLETGDHRDLARAHGGQQRAGVDAVHPRLGMGFHRLDRQLPAKPAARVHAHGFQRHRQQPAGDLLARRDHDIIFGRIIERRGFLAEPHQPVGLARHRRHDHCDLMPLRHDMFYPRGHVANSLHPRHGGAAEFHHDARHLLVEPASW